MAKYKHNERQFEELDSIVASIIEVVGEDRIMEHMICNMDSDERREFVAELVDSERGQIINLNRLDLQESYEEEIIDNLARLRQDDIEAYESMRMRLIWKLAGGKDGL